MNEILNKKILWVVVGLTLLLFLMNIFSNKLVDIVVTKHYEQIAQEVIKKLQKDYCPSPYGPGIDPDKIDVDKLLGNAGEWNKSWGEQKNDSK